MKNILVAAKLESLVLGCTGGLDDEAFMNDILEQMPENLALKNNGYGHRGLLSG